MVLQFDSSSLEKWFAQEKRDLPWRNNLSPYEVWVSEVMLQQTQVDVVISFFERWLKKFPSIQALAKASQEEVLKAWEGLGYYSRARNLHEGAKFVVQNFDGELPKETSKLKKIKGLGPYTIGAIQSFAFHMKAEAVDGNVVRVLARYFAIERDTSKSTTLAEYREIVKKIQPQRKPWVFNEALMELGALICRKQPQCEECPLKKSCKGYAQGVAELLPVKSKKITYSNLYRAVVVIEHKNFILLRKGEKGKVMSDLYEFPYFETTKEGISDSELIKKTKSEFLIDAEVISSFSRAMHSFTKYRVDLRPSLLFCKKIDRKHLPSSCSWVHRDELENLPFSSGHRKILAEYREQSLI